MPATHLSNLDGELAVVPGTVSVWCGPIGGAPTYARLPDVPHFAASTVKVAVLAALFRAYEAGVVDLEAPVVLRNEFDSAVPDAPRFAIPLTAEGDAQVRERIGDTVSLRWLASRMIVRSSNIAANVIIDHIGLSAVEPMWTLVGADGAAMRRGMGDAAARSAGLTNVVTAANLAALMSTIVSGAGAANPLATPDSCREMVDLLLAQELCDDLASGLPAGTRIAHKNGWIRGIRHCAAVVFPDDAAAYALVACASTELADGSGPHHRDAACELLARIAAASWADRHQLQ